MDKNKLMLRKASQLREMFEDLAFNSGTQNEAAKYYNASYYMEKVIRELNFD